MDQRQDYREWAMKEFFCRNSSNSVDPCGDPVSNGSRIYFTKRRMNFVRIVIGFLGNSALYRCPVCGWELKVPIN